MSSEERKQILQMLEEGKITPEQALALIKELEQDAQEPEVEVLQAPAFKSTAAPGFESHQGPAPELERTAARARSLWQIPFWIGALIMFLSAWGIYSVMHSSGYNFWFYCLWLPFLLGVAVLALAAWSRNAHWLFVSVDRSRSQDGPRHIFVGFPLPLGFAGWFLRTFGNRIDGLRQTNVDEVVQAISLAESIDEPMIVNVDDGGDGERVQVFIG